MSKLIQPKIAPPPPNYQNYALYSKAYTEWLECLKRQLKIDNPGDELAGEEIKFQVADNYARYVVASSKPLQLIHLKYGDGYEYPYVTRLRLSDIRREVEKARVWTNLFSRKK